MSLQEPKEPMDETRRLAAVRALGLLDTPPEERFDRIARLAQRTLGVPIVLITLIDERRVWFKSRFGLEETEVPRSPSFCEETLACDGLMIVPDAANDPRFSSHPLVAGGPRIRFYAGQPLAGPDGSFVGTLSLLDRVPRELDLEQKRVLRDLAGMVQEQLASQGKSEEPDEEHARLLARLRLSPEHAAARRRMRAVFFAISFILVAVTGVTMRMAGRLVADADRLAPVVTAAQTPEAAEAGAALARLRAGARFFYAGIGMRGLLGLTLLLIVLVMLDRHLDARLAAQAAVELDRARLRSVLDAIGDGIVVADARGRFTLFNPAAERILGLGLVDHPDETDRFYLSFFEAGGGLCPPARHPLARAVAGESTHGERLIVRNERRPGGVPVVITATPVRSADGAPAGGMIIFRDVI